MKKIAVYAITKNEENNVDKWYESMQEADEIVVLDTGSTDNTVNLLKKYPKIKVFQEKINPWRFDVARNRSLDLVSSNIDICVCTDLDERFSPGWKKELLSNWLEGTTRAKYLYNWSFNEYGKPATTFYLNKIHLRHGYTWKHPVHEVLYPLIDEKELLIPNITLNHYQDFSKPRTSYLPLLEISVKEDPDDDRNMHYLGREYMYYQKYNECIDTLHKHLKLPSSTWKDERCASMRYIAYSYYQKGYLEEAIMWYKKATIEAPYLREPLYDLANLYYNEKDYYNVIKTLKKALKIKDRSITYINEENCWNETIYDLLSLAYFETKNYQMSYKYSQIAKKMNPSNKRILNNNAYIKEIFNQNKEA